MGAGASRFRDHSGHPQGCWGDDRSGCCVEAGRQESAGRVAQGKYLIRPLRTQSRPTTVSAAVQTAILLQGEVQAAVALFTGDDMANLRPDLLKEREKPEELTPQPRPNVLLEAGIASWDSLLC